MQNGTSLAVPFLLLLCCFIHRYPERKLGRQLGGEEIHTLPAFMPLLGQNQGFMLPNKWKMLVGQLLLSTKQLLSCYCCHSKRR